MARKVTLFTGQWADLNFETMCKKAKQFGYDGIELACWGDHVDVEKAAKDTKYAKSRKEIPAEYGLKVYAISNHLAGQMVCDEIDERHKSIDTTGGRIWGDGSAEGVRKRAAEEMKLTAKAAKNIGVDVVNGFTGSSIWKYLYSFPPVPPEYIDKGYEDFAKRWNPILDEFKKNGVKFALEVHP